MYSLVVTIEDLRADVVAHPEDDARREVLADALLEAGDAHGELIRTQLIRPVTLAIEIRERELINAIGQRLVAGLPSGQYLFRRGTIARAAGITPDDFLAAASELRRRGPLEEIAIADPFDAEWRMVTSARGATARFCQRAPLEGIRRLDFDLAFFGAEEARLLAARGSRLASLRVLANDLDGGAAAGLATIPVERLALVSRSHPIDVARALVLSRIAEIDLTANQIGEEGAIELARLPAIGARRALDLHDCGVGSRGVIALASSPHLGELRALTVDGTSIGDAGANAIAELRSLERLALRFEETEYDAPPARNPLNNPITAAGAHAIVGALPALRDLELVMPEPTQVRLAGPSFARLERLSLTNVLLEPDELLALLRAAPRLRRLELACRVDTDAHALAIVEGLSQEATVKISGYWKMPIGSEPYRLLRARFGQRFQAGESNWAPVVWVES
jgi:uncharacterized protein (TIGR02996 family)